MDVRVVDHPLAAARLTTLRDERTDNAAFRAALRDLTLMLVYEATRDLTTETISVRTPLADTTGARLANPPLLVPVLRAGLGMVDQAHALIPEARVGFVGVAHGVELPVEGLFWSLVHLHGGPAPVRRFLPQLVDLIWNRQIDPGKVFDLTLPLEEAAEGYQAMDERRAIKTLLRP